MRGIHIQPKTYINYKKKIMLLFIKDNLYARLRESKGYVGSNAKYRMSAFADQPLFCLHHMKFRSCGKSLFVDEV